MRPQGAVHESIGNPHDALAVVHEPPGAIHEVPRPLDRYEYERILKAIHQAMHPSERDVGRGLSIA